MLKDAIYESVDLLGFWFEIEAYEKNNHRHIVDISESRSSLTGGLFFSHYDDIGPDSVDFERQPSTGSSILTHRVSIVTRQNDNFVEIAISDNGGDVADEIKERIFDPFFTTKEPGKGTGQGLSIAHSIVTEKHAGKLLLESRTGEGSTITLPSAFLSQTVMRHNILR